MSRYGLKIVFLLLSVVAISISPSGLFAQSGFGNTISQIQGGINTANNAIGTFNKFNNALGKPFGDGSGTIFGGGDKEIKGQEFDAYFSDIVAGEFAESLSDPANEFGGFGAIDNMQSPLGSVHLNSRNPCTGGQCFAGAEEAAIIPGTRRIPLQAMLPSPLRSTADYLQNDEASNMAQNNLDSRAVLRDVSLFLAESAVAQGEANAHLKSASLQTNTLLGLINLSLTSSKFEGSQPAMQSFYWCLQKKMEAGTGMPKAIQICSNDAGTPSQAATGVTASAGGFDFTDNPAFDAAGTFNKIRLSDILFNEESREISGQSTQAISSFLSTGLGITGIGSLATGLSNIQSQLPIGSNSSQLIKVRDSFKEIYGDIEFERTAVGTEQIIGSAYRMIAASAQPSDYYRHAIVRKFNTIRGLVLKYCEFYNSTMDEAITPSPDEYQIIPSFVGGGGSTGGSNGIIGIVSNATGLSGIQNKLGLGGSSSSTVDTQLQTISMPGFSMTGGDIQDFNKNYESIFKGHRKVSSGSGSGISFSFNNISLGSLGTIPLFGGQNGPSSNQDRRIWCEPLQDAGKFEVKFDPGDPNPFKNFYEAVSLEGGKEFFRVIFHLSRLLALGEWLTKASIAEQIIEFMSAGINMGSDLELMAKDLIYRTVGSRDIRSELERVTNQLRVYWANEKAYIQQLNAAAAQAGSNTVQTGGRTTIQQ